MFEWVFLAEASRYQQSIEEKEEEFNNVVREYIISLLTFIVLYLCAYVVIAKFHQKKERDGLYGKDEDARAYRISFYLCTFTLAVSCGSVFMLPMSMVGNEVVHLYSDSYWMQWLNGALVHTFWKGIFVSSNLSLFVLLPFSYFFTESEGFSGQRRGLMPRVYETITVLMLLAAVVFGLAVLALAFIYNDDSVQEILFLVFEQYLQYLYSFLLCACVLFMLVACAPLGFTVLFDAVSNLLVKPKMFENNETKIEALKLEEDAIMRKVTSKSYRERNGADCQAALYKEMETVKHSRLKLERRSRASALERNLGYPLVMLLLLALTGLALFLVSIHILKLLIVGDHELHPSTVREEYRKDYRNIRIENANVKPIVQEALAEKETETHWWWKWKMWSSQDAKEEEPPQPVVITSPETKLHTLSLGADSLSSFGIVGTILEVFVIFYLMLASVVGLYNLPGFRSMRPRIQETSMTNIILNCLVLQLLSSSLPVLSRVLGITDFDLQGNFGQFYWLGNFYIVLSFNVIFACITALCLVNKMTRKVRQELVKALRLSALSISGRLTSKHARPPNAAGGSTPKFRSSLSQKASPSLSSSDNASETSVADQTQVTLSSLQETWAKLDKTVNESGFLKESSSLICAPSRNANLISRKDTHLVKENGRISR